MGVISKGSDITVPTGVSDSLDGDFGIGSGGVSFVEPSAGGGLVAGALVNFDSTSIVGSTPVTAWTNIGTGGSAFDLDVVLGTGANLTRTTVNSLDCVNSSGSVGLETTVGQMFNVPMTIFLVANVDALGSNDVFTSSRNLIGSSPQLVLTTGGDFRFNAGSSIDVSPANTNLSLHTVRHNGDSTSNYEVSSVGDTTGSAGAENFDFGSLFVLSDGSRTLTGTICQYIIYDSALSNAEVTQNNDFLIAKFAI